MIGRSAQIAAARVRFIVRAVLGVALALPAFCAGAGECPGTPAAVGAGRAIPVDPAFLHQVGSAQYAQTLPLRDHEIVLSFDDGPSPVTTGKVLDALAAECAKATFFLVGEHAAAQPGLVQRAYKEGHAIGTHSQSHADLTRLTPAAAVQEIDGGIASVQAALGPRMKVAPFFRAPYLQISSALEQFVFQRDLMVWSVDIDPEDWRPQTPERLVEHTLSLLESRRSGILLLHDVQPHTAAALPILLRELKARGFGIVQALAPDAAAKPLNVSIDAVRSDTQFK